MEKPETLDATQSELARIFGVTTRTVRRWRHLGMPYQTERRRYHVPDCVAWREERIREEVEMSARPRDYEQARARREAAMAELAELDVGERRGELAAVADVEVEIAEGLGRMRSAALTIPARQAPYFVGLKTQTEARNQLKVFMAKIFETFYEVDDGEDKR